MTEYQHFKQLYQNILQKPEIKEQAKQAAVVVLIVEEPLLEPYLILIERNEYDGHHSGQMALPGGKMDPSDQDLRETGKNFVDQF